MMTDIDLVYTYVDGSDPVWMAKRDATIGNPGGTQEHCAGRYADHDELKYSLRSVERYAPWIRRIFIVTDNQVPAWLDTTNDRVQIVDHTDIMPARCLPCFNSVVIEHHLHRIDGLSERFIYANDDMLINRPIGPEFFFADDGLPIVHLNRRVLRKLTLWLREHVQHKPLDAYVLTIKRAAALVEARYGIYFGDKTHHNMDAYLKSSYAHTRQVFDTEISATLANHARSDTDIQRNIYSYVPLAEGKAHKRYVDQHTSFHFHIDNPAHYDKFRRYNPTLFCMNDSQFATDAHRERAAQFLHALFPNKSSFEN